MFSVSVSVHACEGQKPTFLLKNLFFVLFFFSIEVKSAITVWLNCHSHHAANTRCTGINAWINNTSKLAWDDRNAIISSWIRRYISYYMSWIVHVCDIKTWKEIFVGGTTIQWWFRSTLFILRKLINLKAYHVTSCPYLILKCTWSDDKHFFSVIYCLSV